MTYSRYVFDTERTIRNSKKHFGGNVQQSAVNNNDFCFGILFSINLFHLCCQYIVLDKCVFKAYYKKNRIKFGFYSAPEQFTK